MVACWWFLFSDRAWRVIYQQCKSIFFIGPPSSTLTATAWYGYPNFDSKVIRCYCSTSRTPINSRHYHCIDLNHRASSDRHSVGFLRTPGKAPIPSNSRRQSPISCRSRARQPSDSFPHGFSSPISAHSFNWLSPSIHTSSIDGPPSLPSYHGPYWLWLRRCFLLNSNHNLRSLGHREFRHKLGHCCHDACPWRRPLGHYILYCV